MEKIIIALGGFGINFLNSQKKLLGDKFTLIAISHDEEALSFCDVENKIHLDKMSFEILDKYLNKAESVWVLNGLGGYNSQSLIPLISHIQKYQSINLQTILTKPFIWEAPDRKKNINKIIKELETTKIKKKIYDNNDLLQLSQKDMNVDELFKLMDKQICDDFLKLQKHSK